MNSFSDLPRQFIKAFFVGGLLVCLGDEGVFACLFKKKKNKKYKETET